VYAVTKAHGGRSVGFNFYNEMFVGAARGQQGDDSTPTFAVNSDGNGSGIPHRLASLSLFAVTRCALNLTRGLGPALGSELQYHKSRSLLKR
jgi:hypothetical protein